MKTAAGARCPAPTAARPSARTSLRASYPRAWVMPGGKVFGVSAERMWSLDPAGNGTLTVHGVYKGAPSSSATNPLNVGATNGAVMFDIGKVLIAGGNGSYNGEGWPASRLATVIDMNSGTPVLTEQAPMAKPAPLPRTPWRCPTAQVLITGGTRRGNNNGADAVYAVELWNPETGTWRTGASAAMYRGYHSTSALLPNGAVLSAGGGHARAGDQPERRDLLPTATVPQRERQRPARAAAGDRRDQRPRLRARRRAAAGPGRPHPRSASSRSWPSRTPRTRSTAASAASRSRSRRTASA